MQSKRTSWQVTRSVWHAMYMREMIARTMADRMAWFWMLFEPIALVMIMIAVRSVAMGRGKIIPGAEFVPWLIVGLFGFTLFRENMMRALSAVSSNKSLFAYRQVKPIDTVFVRCYLEGMLKTFIFLLFIIGGIFLDIGLMPAEPLKALFAWVSLWCLGAGIGLNISVLSAMFPEFGRIVKIVTMPLLLISGVIFPLNFVPHDLLQWVLINPIVHGLEYLRHSFFPAYRLLTGVSLFYIWYWILTSVTLGLILHIRFEGRMKQQ